MSKVGLRAYSTISLNQTQLVGGMKNEDDDYQRVDDKKDTGKVNIQSEDDGFMRADSKVRGSSVANEELE